MDKKRPNLKTESELYMKLATLLNTKRSGEKEKRVLSIVHNSSLSIDEKIKKIRAIDSGSVQNSSLYMLKNGNREKRSRSRKRAPVPAEQEQDPEQEILHLETPQTRMENRLRLIKKPQRQTFLKFLLKEMPYIKDFADKSKVLLCRYLPPSLKMNPKVEQFFSSKIQPLATSLIEPLKFIEENGWLYLNKSNYNLMREFQMLCKRICQLKNEKSRTGEKNNYNRFRRLEDQFFACHYMPGYPEIICTSIHEVLYNSNRFDKQAKGLSGNARRLLLFSEKGPSLYAILLGIHVSHSRRMMELDALINRKGGPIINSTSFNCTQEVQGAINSYVEQQVKGMDVLYKQRQQLIRFKSYIDFNSGGSPDFKILTRMIDAFRRPEDFYSILDPENLLQSAALLANFIDKLTYSLLLQPVPVSDRVKPVLLFTRETFSAFLDVINHSTDELIRLSEKNKHIRITRERMSGATEQIAASSIPNGEIEVMESIMRLSEGLFSLGEELVRTINKKTVEQNEEQEKQNELRGKNLFLQCADNVIVLPGFLEGESVKSALQMLIRICYSAAWFLKNRKIAILFEKQQQIENELHNIFQLIEQLTTQDQLVKIRNLFPMI